MTDVCAIGELLIDWTPEGVNESGGALYACNPGGGPANMLSSVSKMGGSTSFIGKVGRDGFGLFLQKTLNDQNIGADGLLIDGAFQTTLAFVHLAASGDRSFSFYRKGGADINLAWHEVDKSVILDAKILHLSGVSLTDEPCRSTIYRAARFARSAGKVISFDPNYRALLWKDAPTARKKILRLLKFVDILKVSEEEMALLTGDSDLEKGADRLSAMGPAVVLVTLGKEGALFLCKNGMGKLPAYDVKTIDTTGAGDAFLGAVLFRVRGKNRAALKDVSKEELLDIVDFANAAGSLSTTKKGGIPSMPTAVEVERLMRT